MQIMDVKKTHLNNQHGSASVEAALLLPVFIILFAFLLGSFGVVHTGILHSIHARTYAIETIDNRSDATYFRSNRGPATSTESYANIGYRIHGISNVDLDPTNPKWYPAARAIAIGLSQNRNETGRDQVDTFDTGRRYTRAGVNPVWIKVTYGICLDFNCGGLQ